MGKGEMNRARVFALQIRTAMGEPRKGEQEGEKKKEFKDQRVRSGIV